MSRVWLRRFLLILICLRFRCFCGVLFSFIGCDCYDDGGLV